MRNKRITHYSYHILAQVIKKHHYVMNIFVKCSSYAVSYAGNCKVVKFELLKINVKCAYFSRWLNFHVLIKQLVYFFTHKKDCSKNDVAGSVLKKCSPVSLKSNF